MRTANPTSLVVKVEGKSLIFKPTSLSLKAE